MSGMQRIRTSADPASPRGKRPWIVTLARFTLAVIAALGWQAAVPQPQPQAPSASTQPHVLPPTASAPQSHSPAPTAPAPIPVPHWRTVTVELPVSRESFPAGPGADLANSFCLMCHSAGMVLRQPALSREAWVAEVNKMRTAYGAPVPAEQVDALANYLSGLMRAQP